MNISRQIIVYEGPGGPFEGMVVRDTDALEARPGVMLIPNVLGAKEQDFAKAEDVAALGYVVLVTDVFGQGKRPAREDSDWDRYMNEMLADRGMLRDRLQASLAALKGVAGCDATRIAAIGFCFGGLCVLDMARAGLGLAGVVSFHGLFNRPDYVAVSPIETRILACHGWDDPLCPPDAALGLATEMTSARADWQLHAYGHASHAFTDMELNIPEMGIVFDPKANSRSWRAMADFLEEVFA